MGTTIVCWLLGTAQAPELHGPRLRMLFEKVVDTPVRGVLYEPAADAGDGVRIAEDAHATWQIPLEVLDADPADHPAWLDAATRAVERLLGG